MWMHREAAAIARSHRALGAVVGAASRAGPLQSRVTRVPWPGDDLIVDVPPIVVIGSLKLT